MVAAVDVQTCKRMLFRREIRGPDPIDMAASALNRTIVKLRFSIESGGVGSIGKESVLNELLKGCGVLLVRHSRFRSPASPHSL